MNKRSKLTIGIGLTVLLLAAVFATAAFAQGPGGAFGGMMGNGQGMMGGQGFGGMMGGQGFGGMMGAGNAISGTTLAPALRSGASAGVPANCPMFGGATIPTDAQPITFDKAVAAAQQYLTSYNNADPSTGSGQVLKLAEVMEFDNNFYAVVTEKSTGNGAFELLVNRYTGYVHPEPGPNMMWNTRYGHMAGQSGMMGMMGRMMGGAWNQQTGPLTVTVEQARTAAQQWLDANQPGARLADDETQFPGYYTLDFLKDGKTAGMLSVNGYTGQVWYHTWHGNFISEQEF
jgi:hypothetical protein